MQLNRENYYYHKNIPIAKLLSNAEEENGMPLLILAK